MDERDELVEAPSALEKTDGEPELVIDDELLVEDVSIDGMCGVY